MNTHYTNIQIHTHMHTHLAPCHLKPIRRAVLRVLHAAGHVREVGVHDSGLLGVAGEAAVLHHALKALIYIHTKRERGACK
jgi:hypothetical protein